MRFWKKDPGRISRVELQPLVVHFESLHLYLLFLLASRGEQSVTFLLSMKTDKSVGSVLNQPSLFCIDWMCLLPFKNVGG